MRRAWLLALAVLAGLAVLQGSAVAAISDEEEFARIGEIGTGPGQLQVPFGLASDPVTGHLYVTEIQSNRVSEFTPWGSFVKAIGWDVAPGAVNERQEVRVRAAAGQFKLSFGASTTADLPFNASGAEVEAALNGLASIAGGGGGVSVEAVAGNTNGKTPFVYVVAFKGSLAGTDVAQLGVQAGTPPPSGGVPSTELLARTQADGSAGGTGLERCTAESGCKAGLNGAGGGQLADARGVTVDPAGNVYLRELGNRRVQKFDSAGRFALMFGGKVNQTTSANRCTKADLEGGDVCGTGLPGTGPGEFASGGSEGIALCPPGKLLCLAGALFVADKERVQRFSLEGVYESELPVPGKAVQAVAFDPVSEDLYVTYVGEGGVLQKLNSTSGAEIGAPLSGGGPVATDSAGNLFARSQDHVLEYSPGGSPLSPPSCCEAEPLPPPNPGGFKFSLTALGTNGAGDLHVAYFAGIDSFVRAFGPAPVDFEGPPQAPPEISAQFASSVQRDGATVAAEINPRFFPDTLYRVQYGTGKCTEGGCPAEQPVPPGALLTSKISNVPVRAAGIFLEGLTPGTTYHYRFIAQSSGGGPVYGVDPDGEGPGEASEAEGLEATFITPDPLPPKACPNDVFRGGGAARLPNCRAYEMVSPVDKNNGDIKTLVNYLGYSTMLGQSALDGNRLTYSAYRAFADPKGAPFTDQLLATRGNDAWASEALDPPQGPAANTNLNFLGNNFKGFSEDLCLGWAVVAAEPQLDPPRDTPDYPNVYRRDNCGADKGSYEALVGVQPNIQQGGFYPEPQGASADGEAAIFRINDKLTPDAASGPWQAYYASDGELALLCVLPSGLPSGGNCSGGTGGEDPQGFGQAVQGRMASVENAISTDGSRVYWTDSAGQASGAGKVYLRINPGAEQSAGEACEEGKACTLKVSETKSTMDSRFLLATPDGSRALFEVTEGPAKGDLYEFNLEGSTRLIAGEVLGLAGASEDLSRIYFVSEEALEGAGVAEEPNLYLEEEGGEETFIATLSETDAVIPGAVGGEEIPSVTARKPIYHAAQASADGSALAFISNASPTGYDNTDLANGQADSEVYLYEAGSAGPVCVSCNPSRSRPVGRVVRLNRNDEPLSMAAMLPMATSMLHAPRYLSADGARLFFDSFDPLLPRDTNGATDTYLWESAPDKATCAALGHELYVPSAAGCLSLISSGESPDDSEFLDASTNGEDAFFITNASLLAQDPGLFDVYDARAGGGLPPPPTPAPDCQGETCKPPVSAPNDPTPASSTYLGPGDVEEKAKKKKKKKHKKGKKHNKKRGQKGKKRRAAR